jgi:hypothetical protein
MESQERHAAAGALSNFATGGATLMAVESGN